MYHCVNKIASMSLLRRRLIIVFIVIETVRSTVCPCSPFLNMKPPPVDDDTAGIPDALKFDCFPAANANEKECHSRGCCWSSNNDDVRIPRCYYPQNFNSYKMSGFKQNERGLTMNLTKLRNSPYPNDLKTLQMTVTFENESCVRVNIVPSSKEYYRYEPPYPIPFMYTYRSSKQTEYYILVEEPNFGFAIVRRKTGTIIFDTRHIGGFVFSDKFLQLSALLPSNIRNIYGLGEKQNDFFLNLNWQKITLFNRGTTNRSENVNLYGSHPFYLAIEIEKDNENRKSIYSHGVLLFNSNAMDIILQPAPAITYRTIGGNFEFYFFLGPTPEDVIQQYTNIVANRPSMPPYWSLGFHLSKFGLKTLDDTRDLWKRNKIAGLPFDVQWNDIDYMDERKDFTISPLYEGLDKFVKNLHKENMKYVLVLNPGLASRLPSGTYPPYDQIPKDYNIFIINSHGKNLEGKGRTQPEETVYIDFFNPRASSYWCKLMKDLYHKVNYDGLWLNMNEIHNLGDGSINDCDKNNQWDNPPYVPGIIGSSLYEQTICPSARHQIGLHYNLHNVYGLKQCMETNECLSEIRANKRNFILSRSTFIGSGKYAAHSTGNNYSGWDDMKFSIADILSFNLFGIPMVGADICGYHGNATEQLCQRWLQLGAFYPFSRSHNHIDQQDQDPAVWSQQTIQSTKKALEIRYKLLPYLYTLFFHAHASGRTVVRPLFFEFLEDPRTHTINTQFLWGSAFLIVPVLEENRINVVAYFPKETWYDFYTFDELRSNGNKIMISAPLDTIPLFIRAGHIIPFQEPAQNTEESRKNPFGLYVALGEYNAASGDLFWDNGDSYLENEEYNLIYFDYDGTFLSGIINKCGFQTKMILNTIYVLGVYDEVNSVLIDSNPHLEFTYSEHKGILTIQNANIDLLKNFDIRWRHEKDVIEYWKLLYR